MRWIPSLALRGSGAHKQSEGQSFPLSLTRCGERRSDVSAAVVRSGKIEQLFCGGKIDNTTGRARRAADVISKRCSWFVASGVLDGFSLCPPFSPFTAPSVSSLLGDLRRLSVYEGVPLRRRECHVSLRDIEALCGLFCTGDRWCLVCLGVWVLCVCACGLKLAGGTDTQPLRQLSWGCQAGIRDQRLPETGATGRSSLQSHTRELGTH